jgi:ATP-dependent 26S proteasome regulatory subunit
MSPEYFVIPLIMGQASGIIEAIKTGIIIFDLSILVIFLFIFYTTDANYIFKYIINWNESKKSSIIIKTEKQTRSIRYRAIMHFLAKKNETIYRLREDTEFDWEDNEKRSEYLVDQTKEFKIIEDIYGKIKNEEKEKTRDANTNNRLMIEYNTLIIFSNKYDLTYLQKWVDTIVKDYKEYLKNISNKSQLFINVSTDAGNNKDNNEKKNKSGFIIDSVEWESSITFENSYFQNMEEIIKKINFFLQNKDWYLKHGIPYNLGILLYGEPGCGKTRFIKQLMNHTGRHGIDIKLNDKMDFAKLQNIIFKEEIDNTHIIPQYQRILIFEDIDALGDVVKERDLKIKTELQDVSINQHIKKDNENDMLNQFLKFTAASTNKELHFNNNLSYLLNMLDGIHECSGRILIMTTNKVDILDKALIRPGRIDIKINFKKCTRFDVTQMIEKFWNIVIPIEMVLPEVEGKYTGADVINIFRTTHDFNGIKEEFCFV